MKRVLPMLLAGLLTITNQVFSQNIAINATGNQPDTSAMLDVSSTIKGFLAPRMTTAQQNAIPLPATGLLIYNTTTSTFNVNVGTSASPSWTALSFAGGSVTHTLSSSANTITSTVNGISATAPAVNSNTLLLSGNNLTSTVNGIASSALTLPFVGSLNGLTGTAQTFSTGTSGNDFNISSTGLVHKFNIPDAGTSARGLITTGAQTIAGDKTFTGSTTVSGTLTAGNTVTLSSIASGASTDNILTVNTSGVVRKRTVTDVINTVNPLAVIVAASRTTSYSPGSSFSTLAYNSASINVGTAYNTSTGIFTAPATGVYEIIFSNMYSVANSENNTLKVRIIVNGATETEVAGALTPYAFSSISGSIRGNTIVQMNSGQTASISVGNLNNTMTPAVGTGQHTLKIIRLK